MSLRSEIKRKLVHHLALVYMVIYWVTPRWFSLAFFGLALAFAALVEFVRLRRPELNAWLLGQFGGLHREKEIMHPSGIYWTILGCWLTMLVFTNKRIVLPALGCLVFGDAAAAVAGVKWGKHICWLEMPTTFIKVAVA